MSKMTPFRQRVYDATIDRYQESCFIRRRAKLNNRQNKAMLNALVWLEGQGLVKAEKFGSGFLWKKTAAV